MANKPIPYKPIIMRYLGGSPDSGVVYTKGFVVFERTGDSIAFGEYEIGQVHSPERLYGTQYHMQKSKKQFFSGGLNMLMRHMEAMMDDARRRGLNIIEASDFDAIDLIISRHAENFYGFPVPDIHWDGNLAKRD